MADLGYIRETRNGPDLAAQEAAVRGAGVTRADLVYADRLPPKRQHRAVAGDALEKRALIIRQIHESSRIVVPSLDRLGISAIDIARTISAVAAKGCGVVAVDTGKVYDASTPAHVILDDAAAAEATLKRERIRKAAAVKAERGVKGGRKGNDLPPDIEPQARRDWLENVTMSRADVAKKYGRSTSWFDRRYGERGMMSKRGRRGPAKA